MVESGVVERWEVSDQVREALEWLSDATTRILTDTDQPADDTRGARRRFGRGQPIQQELIPEPEPDALEAEVISLVDASRPDGKYEPAGGQLDAEAEAD